MGIYEVYLLAYSLDWRQRNIEVVARHHLHGRKQKNNLSILITQ